MENSTEFSAKIPIEPDAMTHLVAAAAEWFRGGPNFCESIVEFDFSEFVVTVQRKFRLTPGEKLQQVQAELEATKAELEAVRSPWQPWSTRPELGPTSPPILAYSMKFGVQRLDAECHWGMWDWIVDLRGRKTNSITHSHWMPVPPLPGGDSE